MDNQKKPVERIGISGVMWGLIMLGLFVLLVLGALIMKTNFRLQELNAKGVQLSLTETQMNLQIEGHLTNIAKTATFGTPTPKPRHRTH